MPLNFSQFPVPEIALMNMYRRSDFKTWFADVGYLYLVVVAFVVLIFLFKNLERTTISWDQSATLERSTTEVLIEQYADDTGGK